MFYHKSQYGRILSFPIFSAPSKSNISKQGQLRGFWIFLKHIGYALLAFLQHNKQAIGNGIEYKLICAVNSF